MLKKKKKEKKSFHTAVQDSCFYRPRGQQNKFSETIALQPCWVVGATIQCSAKEQASVPMVRNLKS